MKRTAAVFVSCFSLIGCGSSQPRLEGPTPALLPAPPRVAPPSVRAPAGKLYQEDVARAVDEGFPRFLQKVEVEAYVQDGKFVGWAILGLYPSDFWAGVDLRPGDVVVAINGLPIERETQAFDAFQALKTAPRLRVSALRGGNPREFQFEIIPRPKLEGGVAVR